jgi:single-stranded DNA-specific DHH superfamily exonuclease
MGRGAGVEGAAVARRPELVHPPGIRPDEEWFQHDPAVVLEAKQVARELHCDEIIASRLVMLGMTSQQITDYLHPGPQNILSPDETVEGMSAAAAALAAGVAGGDTVAIYADYDVDGQTSLAILSDALEQHGAGLHTGSANAVTGFGLTRAFVEEARDAGAKWLITVDCGSTQVDPIRLAQSLGMRVIVIDHHDVDLANTADHYMNPRVRAAEAMADIEKVMKSDSEIRQRTWRVTVPYIDSLDKLTDRSIQILQGHFGEARFAEKCDLVERYSHPTNTGAMLTWKFAAALHRTRHPETPTEHWGAPLYLAGLGAIADLAPCDDLEVRSFLRVPIDRSLQRDHFHNRSIVPRGVAMVAEELGEDPSRPWELIRTRALLNLPKRTAEIDPRDVQSLLRSRDTARLTRLVPRMVADYERLSAIRRDEMDPIAMAQIKEARDTGEDTYFDYVQLTGFEKWAGYTRMVANNAMRKTNRPAMVFARKGVDEWGQELWKFSGANDCVPESKLGDLIPNPDMQAATTVHMLNWLGEEDEVPNLGGHVEVIAGVCTTENIPRIKAACEAWAADKDRKRKWRPIERKRPRVARRRVTPARLRRLEAEADLLAPIKFPESPAIQVTVQGTFSVPRKGEEGRGWTSTMTLADGSRRRVLLSDAIADVVRVHRKKRFEPIIALGRKGPYYISKMAQA